MLSEEDVWSELRGIVDPCSVSVGLSLNIVQMGLVERLEVQGDAVTVYLRVTTPGCLTALVFERAIRERIERLSSIETVCVVHGDSLTWSEAAMSADALDQLRGLRARRPGGARPASDRAAQQQAL